MLQTSLQPQYKLRVNVRPVKYAYFVREDDLESLTRVLHLVCTQWGGIRSLIIPVQPDLSIAPQFEHLMKLHEPDWFVSYLNLKAADHEDHNQLQRYLHRLWPHRKLNLQIGASFEQYDQTAHTLGTIPDEELKGNELIVHEFAGPQAEHWILLALFGAIYLGQQEDYAKTVRLRQCPIGIDSDNFWKSQFDNSPFSSVLNLTHYGVSPYKVTSGGFDSNHFDVILVSSLSSLCMFWNFRATREAVQTRRDMGRRTLLLPERLLDNSQALEEMITFVRLKLPYPNVSTNLHLRFCVWEEADVEKLTIAINVLGELEEFSGDQISVRHTWGRDEPRKLEDFSGKPIKYRFILPRFPESYFEGVGRQAALSTELSYGRNEVFFTPPQGFRNRFSGATALDFECDVWLRYPKEPRIAERAKSNSWFSRYGLSMVASTADRPHYTDFNLLTEWDTLRLFFEARGYDIRVSKPGTYANALIELVGGLQYIDLLASKPAYLLLDILALKSTRKLAQRIVEQLGLSEDQVIEIQPLLEDMEIVPELKRIPKTHLKLTGDERLKLYRKDLLGLLGQLSGRQIVKRGFYLTCSNCGTPSWHPLRTVQETMICPGCSHEFPLPVEYPEGSGSEIQWEYTLNTLVNRAMDQDVLPTVLALHCLTRDKQACCIVPGLELLQSGRAKAELDFIFISNHEVFVGECKAGSEIDDKDLERARLVASLGVHHFYYCTVTRFSGTSQRRIEELRAEFASGDIPMRLNVLSDDDLLGEAIT